MIRTVLGDIDPGQLGVTFCHEHLLMTGGWPVMNEPDYRLDSIPAAISEVTDARIAGLSALVEMTPNGFGRSADGLVAISQETGVSIVAASGLHKVNYYADNHWVHHYSVDEIAQLLVDEVQVGMDRNNLEGPLIKRSSAKAGVVKVATLYQRPGRSVARFVEAVGVAHATTGVPISTHNDKGTLGHQTLDLLAAAGVSPQHVMLGHIDHNPDPVYLAELCARGAYLIFDRPGRIKYAPDSDSVSLFAALVERGHSDRLLLGSDLARRSYWPAFNGGPGLDYLLTTFLPRLRAEGLEDDARAALVDNPAHALSFAAVA